MTALDIYLWQQSDNFCGILITLAVLATITAIVLCIVHICNVHGVPYYEKKGKGYEDDKAGAEALVLFTRGKYKAAITVSVLFWITAGLLPSTKTIAMMVAIPAIANSEPIQKDLPELYQLAKDALKEQIAGKK